MRTPSIRKIIESYFRGYYPAILAVLLISPLFLASHAVAQNKLAPQPPAPMAFNRVRYFPAPGHEQAMAGGKFCGSNVSATAGFEVLAEIKSAPPAGQWSELTFPNSKLYRWIRYEAPPDSYGNVAELEFYSGQKKFSGTNYGSFGWRDGRNWPRAFDQKTDTWFDSDVADGQYLGMDVGELGSTAAPRMSPEAKGQQERLQVTLSCATPEAVIRYSFNGAPTPEGGKVYSKPITIDHSATLFAIATKDGMAPSPVNSGVYPVGRPTKPGLHTVHVGNSLTGSILGFPNYLEAAGYQHEFHAFLKDGGNTPLIWKNMQTKGKEEWDKTLAAMPVVDHFSVQPRVQYTKEFLGEEAKHDLLFFDTIHAKYPDVQPWIYAEWPGRRNLTWCPAYDSQMKVLCPAVTFENAASNMFFFFETIHKKVLENYKGEKAPRVLPCTLAVARFKNLMEEGKIPGLSANDLDPCMWGDNVHPGPVGRYLLDMVWFAAFYRQSPEGKIPPIMTTLTPEQAAVLQRLAWEVVKNYPDCGLYEEGKTPVESPKITAAAKQGDVIPVKLSSTTPGAWFRYTLDGTEPTRTTGFVYCGNISLHPGMSLKAVAYKSGMADSPVVAFRQ